MCVRGGVRVGANPPPGGLAYAAPGGQPSEPTQWRLTAPTPRSTRTNPTTASHQSRFAWATGRRVRSHEWGGRRGEAPASSLSPFPPSLLRHPGYRRSLPCLGHPPPSPAHKTHPVRTPSIWGPATTTCDSTETLAAAGTEEATNATSRTQDAARARVAFPYVRARDASRTTSS